MSYSVIKSLFEYVIKWKCVGNSTTIGYRIEYSIMNGTTNTT